MNEFTYVDYLFEAVMDIERFHAFYAKELEGGYYTIPFTNPKENILMRFDEINKQWKLCIKNTTIELPITIIGDNSEVVVDCVALNSEERIRELVVYLNKIGTKVKFHNMQDFIAALNNEKSKKRSCKKAATNKKQKYCTDEEINTSILDCIKELDKQYNKSLLTEQIKDIMLKCLNEIDDNCYNCCASDSTKDCTNSEFKIDVFLI